MIFQPVPTNYVFKVGDTIRLGGKVGKIRNDEANVVWDDGEEQWIPFHRFTSTELGVEQPTISQEAKEELERWIEDTSWPVLDTGIKVIGIEELKQKLNSILEKK